jgi:RNA polymerase subunit RPABC4/transcription elongation factor Spt4
MTTTCNERRSSVEWPGMVRVTSPDCLALGCEWDWNIMGCGRCGGSHTFRVCARCLVAPDDELCPAADGDGLAVAS